MIPRLGKKIANDAESYRYLVESIRKFPSQRNLVRRMQDAGFKNARYSNLSAGIVAVHQGVKS